MTIKLAAVTDDGKTISAHFGRASHYVVVNVENGKVVARELRDKAGHDTFILESGQPGHEHHHRHEEGHGFGPESVHRHSRMLAVIQDCQVVLARGMGRGMQLNLEEAGIEAILCDETDIDQAVQLYLAGNLSNNPKRVH